MTAHTVDNFLSDLKAAVMIGQPLEVGTAGTTACKNLLTTQHLDQLSLEHSQTSTWPPRLSAALSFSQQTGSTANVLDALSVRLTSDRWMRRVLRRVSLYLLLLVVTMVLGLLLFFYYSNPYFEGLRSDLRLMTASAYVPPVDPTAWMPIVMVGALLFCVVIFVWMILGGPRAAVKWCGGRRVSDLQQSSVALEAIQRLHQSGLSMEEAIELSCNLVAADASTRGRIETALEGSNESAGLVAWADAMAEAARDRMIKIELWLPLLAVTIIGGVLGAAYCLLIYRPIISILKELSSAAGGL